MGACNTGLQLLVDPVSQSMGEATPAMDDDWVSGPGFLMDLACDVQVSQKGSSTSME
jgi:hypothetical protein